MRQVCGLVEYFAGTERRQYLGENGIHIRDGRTHTELPRRGGTR
jgi:hypothetical protein